jgi:hypothetical protein
MKTAAVVLGAMLTVGATVPLDRLSEVAANSFSGAPSVLCGMLYGGCLTVSTNSRGHLVVVMMVRKPTGIAGVAI